MKYYKRLKVYKASNVEFNPETLVATSYDWWEFVKQINGKIIFNNYNYSSSTCKHQWKVRSVLSDLGIKIDTCIEAPRGLQNLPKAIEHYEHEISKLVQVIAKPRTHEKKNAERKELIDQYTKMIFFIKHELMDNADFSEKVPKYTGFIEALTTVK